MYIVLLPKNVHPSNCTPLWFSIDFLYFIIKYYILRFTDIMDYQRIKRRSFIFLSICLFNHLSARLIVFPYISEFIYLCIRRRSKMKMLIFLICNKLLIFHYIIWPSWGGGVKGYFPYIILAFHLEFHKICIYFFFH